MSAGRRAHRDKPVEWNINVPTSVAAKADLILFDPMTQKPKYGGRSRLVTTLLREHFRKLENNNDLDSKLSGHLQNHGAELTTPHLFEILEEVMRGAGLHQTMPLLVQELKRRTS